jgi:hypothetical protein
MNSNKNNEQQQEEQWTINSFKSFLALIIYHLLFNRIQFQSPENLLPLIILIFYMIFNICMVFPFQTQINISFHVTFLTSLTLINALSQNIFVYMLKKHSINEII